MGGEVEQAGKSVGGKLSGAIKGVLATAAIGKSLSSALTEGADLQQSIGGIETLFKDSAEKVKQNAANAYRTAGMSANEYMELTTSFSASLLSSLGNDTSKAADIADMAMTDMSDNANKMGSNMEDIKNAYQGFAKQNYTMLDNLKLGYGGTKTEMERLLADAQKITGVKYDINNLSDVYSAIHVIQGELGITGTTAKESAETFSGSLQSMKAALKNVLGNLALGENITDELFTLRETTYTFLSKNLLPMIGNVLSGIPDIIDHAMTFVTLGLNVISNNADQIVAQGAEFVTSIITGIVTNLPYLAESAIKLVMSFGNALLTADWAGIAQNMLSVMRVRLDEAAWQILGTDENIAGSLISAIQMNLPNVLQKGVEIITNLANGILQNLPTIIKMAGETIVSFVGGILPMIPIVLKAGADLLLKLVDGIVESLPDIVASAGIAVGKFIETVGENLPDILQTGLEILGELGAGLIKAIPDLVKKIPEIIESIKNEFLDTDWLEIGKNIISGIAEGLKNAGKLLWDAVKEVLGSFKDKVLEFFGIHSPSRWGIYVGKMITQGFANGTLKNVSAITDAMNTLKETTTNPFRMVAEYSVNTRSTATNAIREDDGTQSKLEILISLVQGLLNNTGKEIVINVNGRQAVRVLKELGVAFG